MLILRIDSLNLMMISYIIHTYIPEMTRGASKITHVIWITANIGPACMLSTQQVGYDWTRKIGCGSANCSNTHNIIPLMAPHEFICHIKDNNGSRIDWLTDILLKFLRIINCWCELFLFRIFFKTYSAVHRVGTTSPSRWNTSPISGILF